ncbi:TPA: hypothetical protein ACH3X1_000566 [Trebouxia sp. C0004]
MTNVNPASIVIGRSGGFDLHNSFLSPGLQPPQLKLHREDGGAGQLSNGTMYWLPTHELPEEKWLSPGELLAPFRLYNMIEDQLKWFTGQFPDTVIPRELLRDHLTQDVSPQVLDQHSSYLGNRMAACQDAQQSLVFTCCGLAGHKMAMSVLDRHATPMQCLQRLCIDTGKPIQQLAIDSSSSIHMTDSGKTHSAQQLLLAARGPHQIAIMQASSASPGESVWSLQLVATVRSEQAVRHVAWSPYDPCQAAFICDDGSLHIFILSHCPVAPAGSSVEVHTVVQGGHPALKTDPANRMGCEWTHPTKVACTAGRNLVQCHLLGLARDARVVLHSRPEGDAFLGLARPSQGPGAKQSSYLAASTRQHVLLFDTRHLNAPVLCWAHRMDTEPPQLLALALSSQTPCRSSNMYTCESGQAEAGQAGASPWPHAPTSQLWQDSMGWGSQAGPSSHHMASQADANYSSSLPWTGQTGSQSRNSQAWPDTQASQGPDPLGNPPGRQSKGTGHEAGQVTGAIVGSSLALGECMAFRFMVKPSGQCVTAQPPEDITKKKTRRGPIKFRRRENWGLVQVEEAATSEGGTGFAWRPGIADAVQTWNLARTICHPLKPMSNPTKAPTLTDLAAAHGEEAERMILQCPELQGMTILPATYQHQPSNAEEGGQQQPDQQQPDILMLRSSFVGDLFMDPCFFFAALPDRHVPKLRRHQQSPHQILTALPIRTGAHQAAERQPLKAGAAVRAHAPAAERQAGPKAERQSNTANGQAEGGSQKAGSAADGQEPLVQEGQGAVGQSRPRQLPVFNGGLTADGQAPKARGKRKAAEKEDLTALARTRADVKGAGAPEQALPAGVPVSMLKNIDIRQHVPKAEVKRRRQANPRWKTNKFEVMFDQKGLFQTDVSVHHALFTAALHSYHSATQLITKGSSLSHTQHPDAGSAAELAGNAWGFDHMNERVEAAQGTEAAEEADEGGLEVRLPELQSKLNHSIKTTKRKVSRAGALPRVSTLPRVLSSFSILPRFGILPRVSVPPGFKILPRAGILPRAAATVDELEARTRWEAVNANGRNAAFDAAVPGPRFKAPATAAVVARALPIVMAAHKSLRRGEASSSACDQASTFLTFASAAAGPAVQAACQGSRDPDQPGMVFSRDKLVPLASWKGASLGPELRSTQHSGGHGSQLPDTQASVHPTHPSQGLATNGDRHTIPLVPADRAVGGGQLACPVVPAHSWCGARLMPPAEQPFLSLNSYYAAVGPGQERDDIAELEALWLSSNGQQCAPQSSPGLQATASADGQQTPVGQRSTLASNQEKVGAFTATGRRSAASHATGLMHSQSQAASTDKNESNAKTGKRSFQFAINEGGQRRLIDTNDAKEPGQNVIEENDAVHRQTVSPAGVSNPAVLQGGQDAARLPFGPPQTGSVLQSKSNAKRSKSRTSFVEGF